MREVDGTGVGARGQAEGRHGRRMDGGRHRDPPQAGGAAVLRGTETRALERRWGAAGTGPNGRQPSDARGQ